jgi:hypothetical protein
MRDYILGWGGPNGIRRVVAEWPIEDIRRALAEIEAGLFERLTADGPTVEQMLERLRIELVARSLAP